MPREGLARIVLMLVALAVTLTLAGCTNGDTLRLGRKGSLEVPGAVETQSGFPGFTAPEAREGNVVATEGARVPTLEDDIASEAQFRTADIRRDNADAPEAADAIPEGPIAADRAPRRRFLLDFLL